MVIVNLVLFLIFLVILIKGADYAVRYSSRLAKIMSFPEFIVSFFIVAFISVLPEGTISLISALRGEPGLGLGTLIGSNVADLTLVFGIVSLFSYSGIKVKSSILSNNLFYIILLFFPLLLGIDGYYSRIDGAVLLAIGMMFYYKLYLDSRKFHKKFNNTSKGSFVVNLALLILSLIVIIISAYLTVTYSVSFAYDLKIPAVIVGGTILALGTCLPELIFSVKAVRKNRDSLALGDLLGTVITDATILFGIVALISPFKYQISSIYLLTGAMFVAGLLVIYFMKSERKLSKLEGVLLLLGYILFLFLQFFVSKF